MTERRALGARVAPVVARDHPRRGALVDVEVGRDLLHLGHDLDRRRAGADHRDALAGQVDGVVPPGGVEQRPGEGVEPVDVGQAWLGQAAGGGDQDLRAAPRRSTYDTASAGPSRPRRRARARCRSRSVAEAVVVGDAAQIGLDLRLGGVRRRPVGVAGEGERVELAGHVAAGTGIGVVAPGAADVVGLLDHHEVGLAVLEELDRGAEPGEAGADDQVVDLGGQGRRSHAGDGSGAIE